MKPRLNINEYFICKIWENSGYYSDLQTTDGEDVEIISYGRSNYGSGPDYKDAKVKINGKTFTGDVEIHRDFKNWAEHNHPKDRKYNPVILHVVLWDSEDRKSPKLRIKRELPTVILSHFLKRSIHDIWQDIITWTADTIKLPCYSLNHMVSDEAVESWFETLAMERLKLRSARIKERLSELSSAYDISIKKNEVWEQILYEFIFEALGFSQNKQQMMNLASALNLDLLKEITQNNNTMLYLQAVLFGTAGFLFDVRQKDDYIDAVKKIWKQTEEMIKSPKQNRHEWNFFPMRPQNFPTIRIAYGAQIINRIISKDLFRKIIDEFDKADFEVRNCNRNILNLFRPEQDSYWSTHYDFGKISKKENKLAGKQRIEDIAANVLVPLVYLYALEFKNTAIKKNILNFYTNLKTGADNSIINVIKKQVIKKREIKLDSPAKEQAAIQLYNFYCTRERCIECEIGKNVFKDSGYEYKIIFY